MVYLLKSFIYRACPNAAYWVNLLEEIEQHMRSSKRPPLIVIDAFPTLFMLDRCEDVATGGRHISLLERATNFFQALINAGAKLVFFIDGPLKEAKFPNCMSRLNGSYESDQEVFETLRTSPAAVVTGKFMTLYYTSYQLIIQKFGKAYVSLKNESDADIAIFANRTNAFAVMTCDNDFLIFHGDWRIWCTNMIDVETFDALEWNKALFRKKLMLGQKFMPIFATLCGTDYMPKECVEHIRESMGEGYFQLELARLVQRVCPNGTPLSEDERKALLDLIQKDQKTSYSESEIETFFDASMDFYCHPDRPTGGIKEAWLRKHVLETQSTIVYIILNNIPIPLPQIHIDAQLPNVKQYCELALPLFQRQMGVVLRDKDSSHKHEVLYKPNHEERFDRRFIELIEPTIEIPPIEDILLSNEVKIETKLDILCAILLPGNDEFRRKVPLLDMKAPIFVPILKICYLKENNQITMDEADVLLLSLYESIKIDSVARQNMISPKIFDPKAFWIGMVFNQINTVFLNCLIVSGLYEYIQPEIYDGFIFHKRYATFFETSSEERSALIEPIKQLRIYAN